MQHWKTSYEERKAAPRNTESPDSSYSQDAPSDNPYSNVLKGAPTHIDVSAPSAPQQTYHCELLPSFSTLTADDKERSRRLV